MGSMATQMTITMAMIERASAPSLMLRSGSLIDVPVAQPVLFELLAVLLIAAYCDLRERRIPNLLNIAAALLAVGTHAITSGGPGFWGSVLACALWLGIGFFLYTVVLAQGIGAGDLKLLATAAAYLGFMPALYLGMLSFLLHVLWMMCSWFAYGVALKNFKALFRWLFYLVTPKAKPVHFLPLATPDRSPHAPFIFVAAIAFYPLWRLGVVVP
jgi:Flp pilus assembly protein protease CpaA